MSTPSSTLLALQVLENDPELLWSVFQKFDVDGTGYIEVEEIQEVQWETESAAYLVLGTVGNFRAETSVAMPSWRAQPLRVHCSSPCCRHRLPVHESTELALWQPS